VHPGRQLVNPATWSENPATWIAEACWSLRVRQTRKRLRESMELGLGPGRESNEELRHTTNSTTTSSSQPNLVSTTNQPSHDTNAGIRSQR
jgi:hypothetical protein